MTLDTPAAPDFATKKAMYEWIVKQTTYLVEDMSKKFTPQSNLITALSNVSALCFYELNRFSNPGAGLEHLKVNWFGFYLFQAPGMLALGPFQGRPACTEIRVGRGVCGVVAEKGESLVVKNVHDFPGHIACDSASESEVVVPILLPNGSVVAVIDVDSTVEGHFDDDDREGLEKVAEVLIAHLEFPMARALAVNPALGLPGFNALAGGEKAVQQHEQNEEAATAEAAAAPTPPTAVVTRIPFFKVEARQPDVTTKHVSGWQFTTTRLDRIMTQEETEQMQNFMHVSSLPEIAFQSNALELGPESDRQHPWLVFNVEGVMRSASEYYHTEEFKRVAAPELSIPVSAGWETSDYAKYDPNVDWAWRNAYFGVVPEAVKVVPRPEHLPGINWDLLKDNTLPILFYGAFDMMEDDLHDHGMVTSSVKYRVMESAFFVLYRHFVRVNGVAVWMREVRVFHEFGQTNPETGMPHIVLLEQFRRVSIADPTEVEWKSLSQDVISAQAAVLLSREWVLAKANAPAA